MHDLTDLLVRAQKKDTQAYGQIVKCLQDISVGYGYSLLRDFHLAEDAAQEAFLEAYDILPRLQVLETFPGLLRKIVHKHCDRLTRGGRRYRFMSAGVAIESTAFASDLNPEEQTEEQEMKQLIREAMESLSRQEREIVSMFYISDHSQKEIAAFLEISVHTVKNRLRSARKRLKERLLIVVEENLQQSRPSKDERFADSVRRIIAPSQEQDTESIYDLLEKKLQRPDMAFQARHGRIADSHYDWITSRIALDGDELAAHIGIYEIRLRLGIAQVRVAGINVDYPNPHHDEGRDLFDQAIEAAMEAMCAHGYDLSIVRTTDLDVYGPHGYVSVMPFAVSYTIKAEDLPTELPDVQLREIDLNDVHSYPGVAKLYNRENEGVSMTAVRPTYPHGKCPTQPGEYGPAFLLLDENEKLVGYFSDPLVYNAEHNNRIEVTDSAGDPEQRLRILGQIARQYKGCQEVDFFNLPHGSALARYLRQLGFSGVVGKGRLEGHIPMRIVNLNSTLEHMVDEFTRRLRMTGQAAWSGALRITVADQTAFLMVDKGTVAVVDPVETAHTIEGGQEMARLLVGTDTPDKVVTESEIQLKGDSERLIHALFPPLHPVLPNEYL
ncbi:MAG: sigma-70 family RNA polymerase sigma factor [Gemmatimonadetes bacterium]|nr:sigma-70 family RNA polymerase sigma factor [Gemmatimonadota bacterium]